MVLSVIDLDRLREASEGDPLFAQELLATFVADTREHLQKLASVMADSANTLPSAPMLDAIHREAHHIKGGSGEIGAQVIYAVAEKLVVQARWGENRLAMEQALTAQFIEQLTELHRALEVAYEDTCQRIEMQFLSP